MTPCLWLKICRLLFVHINFIYYNSPSLSPLFAPSSSASPLPLFLSLFPPPPLSLSLSLFFSPPDLSILTYPSGYQSSYYPLSTFPFLSLRYLNGATVFQIMIPDPLKGKHINPSAFYQSVCLLSVCLWPFRYLSICVCLSSV